jgi:hypothetical protein
MISFVLLPKTVVFASQDHLDLMSACDVNLGEPDAINKINALIVPANGTTYAACQIIADSTELIRLCQSGVSEVLSAAQQQVITLPQDGVYDCDTAGMVLQVAQLMQQDVGEASQWPLGRSELVYLLGSSQAFQNAARGQLQPSLGFVLNGVVPVVSSEASIGSFIAAQPPLGCSPAHLHLEDPPVPSTGFDSVSYLSGVEGGGGSSNRSGIGFWGGTMAGIAVAVGSAAAYGYWKENHP